MRVLVTGGDRFVGRHLCCELVDRRHTVMSLSRTLDTDVLPNAAETTTGDVTDYESIRGRSRGWTLR